MNTKNYALITGAGAGLGKAMARECARRKLNLILVSLPDEGLQSFCNELINNYEIEAHCYELNLADINKVYELADEINQSYAVNFLINNAGVGGSKPFDKATPEYIDNIITINVRATTMLTRLLIDNLKQREKAYVLNVASLASFSPFAYKTVYPASKAFIYSFSRGLNEELKNTNIFVSVIHPGPMATNPDVTARIKKHGWFGKLTTVSTHHIAKVAVRQVFRRDSLILPGLINRISWLTMKLTPVWLFLIISAKAFKKEFKTV